ncbi:hypothetical protein Avbf_12155, partial [Armadillidium vulgare]
TINGSVSKINRVKPKLYSISEHVNGMYYIKEFLECVETRRLKKPCKIRSTARGNLPNLRTWIKKLFWTSSSCLLNEALKRK